MECNRILDFEYKFTIMVFNLTFPNPNLFSKNKILSMSTAGTPSNDLIITIIKYKRMLLIIEVFQIIEICLTKF
jgi:hypothetical protein